MKRKIGCLLLILCLAVFASALAEAGNRTITFDAEEYIVYMGQRIQIRAQTERKTEDAPRQTELVWSSADESIVKAARNGSLTPVAKGKTTVTAAAADDGQITKTVPVEVRIPVSKVTVDPAQLVLLTGADESLAKAGLKYGILPEDAYHQKVVWTSSNESVAKVDENGVVTAQGRGSATITAKSDDPSVKRSAACRVNVIQAVTEIVLEQDALNLPVAKNAAIRAKVMPADAGNKKLVWSSSDENIVTVNASGNIKAVSPGEAVITAEAADGSGVRAECRVKVVLPVKKITLTDKNVILAPDTAWQLEAILEPADATVQELTWSSSNEKVAKVDENGKITAFENGSANITVTAADGGGARTAVAVKVMNHDLLILEPGEIEVGFETRDSSYGSYFQVGSRVWSDTMDTTVTFRNGLVAEGSGSGKLRPLKAGSEEIQVVTKHNRRTVTAKATYRVFVAQSAVKTETDAEIRRLEARNFGGHTYQVFAGNRLWEDADAFCQRHGGHLVTITSEEEQKFLEEYLSTAPEKESYWIGLRSDKNARWTSWVTKEAISYTNWAEGNPDRGRGFDCARMAASTYRDANNWTMNQGTWDDESNSYYYIKGFICEWDREDAAEALPALPEADQE